MDTQEIEQILLAKIIVSNKLIDDMGDYLHKDLFEDPFHKSVYHAIKTLHKQNKTIDILSLSTYIGGDNITRDIADIIVYDSVYYSAQTCVAVLTEKYQKSLLAHIVSDVNNSLSNQEELELIIDKLNVNLEKLQIAEPTKLSDINQQAMNFLSDVELRMNTEGLLGISSGFESIDKFTGGWQETDLIVVGGASSMGKTSFALALAYNAALHSSTPTVIFSYEMSAIQLIRRLASMDSGISNRYITNGTINMEELKRIHGSISNIQNLPLHIDETNVTSLNYLLRRIREYVTTKNVKLIMVDYLQLVSYKSKGSTREQEVSQVARSLKNLAKELNITIIALSQLNRGVGMRNNSKPTLADLRESGEIEQASDVVILIYRPEYYGIEFNDNGTSAKNSATIIFAKGRNIGVGEVTLGFKNEITKFVDYETI
jgi:replicative DNA helicase|tara:strand:+ start:1454 stop:2743 length:1290 start_codon:yes stop_codon:yes gene_type:complete